MKKYLWFLIPLMIVFWVGNFAVTQYALLDLIGRLSLTAFGVKVTWAAILAMAFCVSDFAVVLDVFADKKVSTEEVASESNVQTYFWMMAVFVNAVLICVAFSLFYAATLEIAIIVGLIYFALRATVFMLIPTYLSTLV